MALYDYKCRACGRTFEVSKGMNETVNAVCEHCGSEDTSRVFTPVRRLSNSVESLDSYGTSNGSGGCDTCTSGVCSTCGNH